MMNKGNYHARFKDRSHRTAHVVLTPALWAAIDLIHTANPSWARNKIINYMLSEYIKQNYNIINDLQDATDDETE